MIRFDAPVVLWVAPAVALLVLVLAAWARSARLRRAGRWSADLRETARRTNRGAAPLLALVSLGAMLALADPRWGRQVVTTETQALDLVIAVDISRSMLAEDVEPSRLDRARVAVRRLLYDLEGDRIGLIGFAGSSFILSPLTIDGGALQLLVDALHPELVSSGGTGLARALRQGHELLRASDRIADRVLVVFTDGEAHDSLTGVVEAAERLRRDGIRLVLVAEGGVAPARIPVREVSGERTDWHRDADGEIVQTRRRDDVLTATADAAEGALVAAGLDDQAGAVRELLVAYKRAPESSTSAEHDIPRGWIPLLAVTVLLLAHTLTRRSAALTGFGLLLAGSAGAARAQAPDHAGDRAWREGAFNRAAAYYLAEAQAGRGGDTAWYNAGTAYLAGGQLDSAAPLLDRAAGSLDPDLRFQALYNLGLTRLRQAAQDSTRAAELLADARRRYREALLLRPGDGDAKWNLELATADAPPPPSGGGAGAPPPSGGGAGEARSDASPAMANLTPEQARQILESIAAEERETRMDVTRRAGQVREPRRGKDW